jgi:hypothetical protein
MRFFIGIHEPAHLGRFFDGFLIDGHFANLQEG